jgi:hypothetical protein
MLNGVRYQCREEVVLHVLTMQSTTKDNRELTTISIVAIEGSNEGNKLKWLKKESELYDD